MSEEREIDEKTIKVNIDKIHSICVIGVTGKQQRIIKVESNIIKSKIF